MGRDHHPRDGDAGALFEGGDPAQGLGGQSQRLAPLVDAPELAAEVVVAVDAEGDSALLAEQAGGRGVGDAGVERDHRQRQVVAVRRRVAAQLGQGEEAVGGPVQVGVVEQEGGPKRGRAPGALPGQPAQQLDQRQQRQRTLAPEPVAQRFCLG